MQRLKKLKNDSIALVDSIVFKLDYIGVQDTLKYMEVTGQDNTILNDKSLWKYYNNLLGIKHAYNNDISVLSIDTELPITLTKETIYDHPMTHTELYNHNSLYTELINKHPLDVTYINGIINQIPYTMETLLSIEDGKILSYNTNLVEDNEYDLIDELESYIKGFLSRWYNYQYAVTDNLYLASILGILYPKLVLKVMNIRLANIHTYQVHSTYVDLFFRNHHTLHKHVHVLNRDSKMWLYRNLRYLNNHIGKDNTLQEIIDNVFTPNDVGVGEVKRISKQFIDNNIESDITKPLPSLTQNLFQYKARNDSFILLRDNIDNPKDILAREIDKESQHYLPKLELDLSSKSGIDVDRTKMLQVDRPHIIELSPIDKLNLVIEVWFYKALLGEYNIVKLFTDVTTGVSYKITPKQGMLLFIKILSDWVGSDGMVSTFTHREIPKLKDKDELLHNLWLNDRVDKYVDNIIDTFPMDKEVYTDNYDVKDYVYKIIKYSGDMQLYISNFNDEFTKAIGKDIGKRIFKKGVISICDTPTDIDVLLLDNDIHYDTDTIYDYTSNLYQLTSIFTGLGINELKGIDSDREHFRAILKKLTSYTVQLLGSESSDNVVRHKIPFDSINHIQIPRAVTIKEGYIDCLHSSNELYNMWDVIYKPIEVDILPNRIKVYNLNIDKTRLDKDEYVGGVCNINGVTIERIDNYMSCLHFINDIKVHSDYPIDTIVQPNYVHTKRVDLNRPTINVNINDDVTFNDGGSINSDIDPMECLFLIDSQEPQIAYGLSVTASNDILNITEGDINKPKLITGISYTSIDTKGVSLSKVKTYIEKEKEDE